MGDFADRIGTFDDEIGIFTGGIATFKSECDSGADKMLEAFSDCGLTRRTAEAMWQFFERANSQRADQEPGINAAFSNPMFPAMLADAVSAPLPRLHLRVLRIALGWADTKEESMRAVARDYQYSPEQISNLVEAVQVKYKLPANQFNKSDAALKRYAGTNGK